MIHDELSDGLVAELEGALAQNRKATIVLAPGGSAEPAVLAGLLARHENLHVDLAGMHFLRTPALVTEAGSLTAAWRGRLTKPADRSLRGSISGPRRSSRRRRSIG